MKRSSRVLAVLTALVPLAAPAQDSNSAVEDVSPLLAELAREHGVPALAGAVVRGGELVSLGATGLRARGAREKATPSDPWHVGSCTKAMTATLCARLVERGDLAWDATLADHFPELAERMDPEWKNATLELLLQHRAGAPSDLRAQRPEVWGALWSASAPPHETRRWLVRELTGEPPASSPGERFAYSNAGYVLAGAMAERAAGAPFEELLARELFESLRMSDAGFGAPGSRTRVDAPRGHREMMATLVAVAPGPDADNPPALAPAGTVHAPLRSWARFAALHIAGARGESDWLRPETWERLHAPPPADGEDSAYAMGWGVLETEHGRALVHAGSNTMWYARISLYPDLDVAVLAATNTGGDAGERATAAAVAALLETSR